MASSSRIRTMATGPLAERMEYFCPDWSIGQSLKIWERQRGKGAKVGREGGHGSGRCVVWFGVGPMGLWTRSAFGFPELGPSDIPGLPCQLQTRPMEIEWEQPLLPPPDGLVFKPLHRRLPLLPHGHARSVTWSWVQRIAYQSRAF